MRHFMNARKLWSRILTIVGSIAMLVGAIDPLEGSLLILPGSGLIAIGTFLGQGGRRVFIYRIWVFILIAIGVGALWGLSAIGGLGGPTGHSNWWAVLILPYLIGWYMGLWGPESPRWMLWLGIVVGLWYLALCVIILTRSHWIKLGLPVILAAVGVLTIGGCVNRLTKRIPAHQ
jgi:hypothetical protein